MNTNPSGTKTDALSYTMLRQAVGIMGMALPFVLILGAWLFFHTCLRGSISAYYYTHMRDVLVGTLWVIGFFLLSYHGPDGRNSIDDWAGNLACIFAVGASLFPTDPPGSPTNPPGVSASFSAVGIIVLLILLTLGFFLCRFTRTHPGHKLEGFKKSRNRVGKFRTWILVLCVLLMVIYRFVPADATIAQVHKLFSLLFFLTLAFFALCLFTQTHPGHKPEGFKIKRNRIYRLCGWIIVGCMVLIDIYMCVPTNATASLERCNPVLWLETIMVLSFGVSWWVKGEGLRWLNDRKA
jgi:hypothetical protein